MKGKNCFEKKGRIIRPKHTDVFASTLAGGVLLIRRATTASLLAIT
jgi:hypothetical protein